MTSPALRSSIRNVLESRLNEKGELHLDKEATAVILAWLCILEKESALADNYVEEIAKLIGPMRRLLAPRNDG